jgi:glyoxylase-like metal-dependent hydrolase (beta-lactamase superfamily II)
VVPKGVRALKPNRAWLLFGFAVVGGAAFLVSRADANPEIVRRVAPGVWFREGDRDQGHSNNTIIEMKDYLIVVDANFPSGARATMVDVKRLSTKPVKYVFDTHHHGDHLYGNPLWTQEGATTLAFQAVGQELKRLEPGRWLEAAKTRPDVADLHRDGPEPPKQDISKDEFVLSDGQRKVEFHHYGWGHTRGDGFVYLPKEGVLCTGDAVVNGPYNNLADANIANWPAILRTASKLKPKFVLPGHGPQWRTRTDRRARPVPHRTLQSRQDRCRRGQKRRRGAGFHFPPTLRERLGQRCLPQSPGEGHLRGDQAGQAPRRYFAITGYHRNVKRILLATTGSLGDLHPILAIGLGLRQRGTLSSSPPAIYIAKR